MTANQLAGKAASKYCFRARCHVIDALGKPLGYYVSHSKSPRVSERVLTVGQICSPSDFPPGASCDPDVELTLFPECPVECIVDVACIVFDVS